MTNRIVFAIAGALLLSPMALSDDAPKGASKGVKSGLQPGDKTSPFHVRDITGPKKGESLCYV